ncbi:unnamed protein product, partial [Polarella glacialis]
LSPSRGYLKASMQKEQGQRPVSLQRPVRRSRTASGSYGRPQNGVVEDDDIQEAVIPAVSANKRPAPFNEIQSRSRATQQRDLGPAPAVGSNESQSRSRALQQSDQGPHPAVGFAARVSSVDSSLSAQSGNSIQLFKQEVACGPMVKWTSQLRKQADVVAAPAKQGRVSNYTFSNQVKSDGEARRVFQPLAAAAAGGADVHVEEADDDDWKSWKSGGVMSGSECSDNGSFTPRRSDSNASHQGNGPLRSPSVLRMQEYLLENHDVHTASAVRMELLYSRNPGGQNPAGGPSPSQPLSSAAQTPTSGVQANPPASLPLSKPVSPPSPLSLPATLPLSQLSPLTLGQLQQDLKPAPPPKLQEIKKQMPARVFNFAFSSQEKSEGKARRVFQPLSSALAPVEADDDQDDDWKSWRSEGSNMSEVSESGSFTLRPSVSISNAGPKTSASAVRMQDFLLVAPNDLPEAAMSIFPRQDLSSRQNSAEGEANSGQAPSHGQPQAKQKSSVPPGTKGGNHDRAGNCVFSFSQEQGDGPPKRFYQPMGVGPAQPGAGAEH